MITTLTKKQKEKFPAYVDKWIKIGLSTERANREISEKAIKNLYALANLKEPRIIWCPCPISGSLSALFIGSMGLGKQIDLKGSSKAKAVGSAVYSAVCSAVYSAVDSAVNSAVNSAVGSAVDSAVGSAVDSAVYSAVGSAVDSAVYSAVDSAVGSAVDSAVGSAVDSAVDSAVGSAVDSAVDSAVRLAVEIKLETSNGTSYFGGSLWPGYGSWADFFNIECGIKIDRNYLDLQQNCGFYFCLEGFCIATERPTEINLKDGKLHSEKGMSIKYESGWGLYHLNGVKVPKYLVETPKEKLSMDSFKKEENADIRAEFIRKYGIERMISLGKVVDSYRNHPEFNSLWGASEYELIDMSPIHEGMTYAPYLKMKNLTTGIFHLEGVSESCETVKDALNDCYEEDMDNYETISIK